MLQHGDGKIIPGDTRLKEQPKGEIRTLLEDRIREDILQRNEYAEQVETAAGKYNKRIDQKPAGMIEKRVEADLVMESVKS